MNIYRDQFKKPIEMSSPPPSVSYTQGRVKLFSQPVYLGSNDTLEVAYNWKGPPIKVSGIKIMAEFVSPKHGHFEAWMEEMDKTV